MAETVPVKKKILWEFSTYQQILLLLLFLTFVAFHYIRGHPALLTRGNRAEWSTVSDAFIIEVIGPVDSPGIYTFPARVAPEAVLIKAGLSREHLSRMELPRNLENGSAIVVCQSNGKLTMGVEPMSPAKRILYAVPVDLNKVGADELALIPGIGPSLAAAIVSFREKRGGFARIDELLEVSGVGRKKFEILRRYLTIEKSAVSR